MSVSPLFQALWDEQGFTEMSPIQEAVYQPLKKDQSILGLAPTGSGKTLAFSLPLLEKIMPGEGLQVLILAPSQELVIQTRDVIQPYAKAIDCNVQAITGKANVKRQIERLKAKPEIIVATTGRLLELSEQRKVKFHTLQAIIMDEADELLTDSGLSETRHIVQESPADVQLGFFSATSTDILLELETWFGVPIETIDVRGIDKTGGEVLHAFIPTGNAQKVNVLRHLAHQKNFRGLVIFNQSAQLLQAAQTLKHQKVTYAALSGQGRQTERQKALKDFREGKIQLLLATDVAGRGLDITDLPYVINFDVPNAKITYIHRAGRTGRMGRTGTVLTLGNQHDGRNLRKLLAPEYDLVTRYLVGDHLEAEKPVTPKVAPVAATKATSAVPTTGEATEGQVQKATPTTSARKAKLVPVRQQPAAPLKPKHKKNRKRNQKNKGYHKKNND
ncbi:DEAD/DEAH box helicase [Latilactobacillus curvatus]|uniref:Helicase n=2 Tax=Latilactobacillus curvatus TaxID=28038 RepID=A0A1B2A5K3_LATCU|nr:DEAD/DEAH box helicase [Latilactobacillus curvatus]ANJ69856.1 helicase [Latilactobacillus curvatus]ANY13296.1 helicase [Latilactobacillus curvatus]ASN61522.1 ATP-dependent helicase [Latilactobacillus curvatus]AWV72426.1 ATP-dependent helicase [Latilactobacillus curvatus]AXN35325.1 DEAD/DEAH box helicase [Latilactobacillus curvatus]